MTRWPRRDYSPNQLDQGVSYEKVFDHKKETCDATALPGTSSEKNPPAAGESFITVWSRWQGLAELVASNDEALKG
jgi:hypothetical protein